MIVLRIVLAFIVPIIVGYLVISLLDKHKTISHFGKIVLGYVVGIGSIGLFMFSLGLLSIPYNITNVYMILLPIIFVLLFFVIKYKRYNKLKLPTHFFGNGIGLWGKIFFLLFIIIFSYKIILGITFVSQSPTYQDDAFGRWNFRAKVFYYRQEIPLDKKDNEYLGIPGNPYDLAAEKDVPVRSYLPINNLQKTWIAINMGQYIDEFVNLLNPMTYAFFILSVFFLFVFVFNKKVASIGGIVLMGLPYLWIHGTAPYADIFTAMYFTISLLLLYIVITGDKDDKKDNVFKYIFAILMMLFVLWKKEAMFYALSLSFAMFLHNIVEYSKITVSSALREIKNVIYWPMIGGFIYLASYLAYTGYITVYWNQVEGMNQEFFHPDVFGLFLNVISYQGCFNLIGLFAVLIIIYYFKDIIKSKIKYLYLAFILVAGLMFYSMSSTNAYYEIQHQTGVNRALVTLFSGLVVILMLTIFSNYNKIEKHKIEEVNK